MVSHIFISNIARVIEAGNSKYAEKNPQCSRDRAYSNIVIPDTQAEPNCQLQLSCTHCSAHISLQVCCHCSAVLFSAVQCSAAHSANSLDIKVCQLALVTHLSTQMLNLRLEHTSFMSL